MSSEESEEKKKSDWHKERTPILKNVEKSIALRKTTLKKISDIQKDLDESTEHIRNDITRLGNIQGILRDSNAYLPINPVTKGTVDIMTSLSIHDLEAAQFLASKSEVLRTNANRFHGTVVVSGSMVSSMATTTFNMTESMENREPAQPLIVGINEPTTQDRRAELSAELSEIESRLATKLEGAWQTIYDLSKDDRFLQAASSIRELISDVLHSVAPDDQVKTTQWFTKETESGNPTQRQRARYDAWSE